MPVMADKDLAIERGYRISPQDVMDVLDGIPYPKDKSVASEAQREAIDVLYSSMLSKLDAIERSRQAERDRRDVPRLEGVEIKAQSPTNETIWKNELVKGLKQKSIFYCHQLTSALSNREQANADRYLALQETYAMLHDLLRENL